MQQARKDIIKSAQILGQVIKSLCKLTKLSRLEFAKIYANRF